jgi:uncharacterized protein
MDFINSPVDLSVLPAAEDVALKPVQPAYKKVLQVEWRITTVSLLLIAGAVIFFSSSLRVSLGWLVITLVTLFIIALHWLSIHRSFPFLAYAVREKDVIHQSGWLIRTIKVCPFNRVQNCSVRSGPLERRYHLASLIIYTAGSGGADIRISGLLQEEADKLRYYILEKIHAEPDEAV